MHQKFVPCCLKQDSIALKLIWSWMNVINPCCACLKLIMIWSINWIFKKFLHKQMKSVSLNLIWFWMNVINPDCICLKTRKVRFMSMKYARWTRLPTKAPYFEMMEGNTTIQKYKNTKHFPYFVKMLHIINWTLKIIGKHIISKCM